MTGVLPRAFAMQRGHPGVTQGLGHNVGRVTVRPHAPAGATEAVFGPAWIRKPNLTRSGRIGNQEPPLYVVTVLPTGPPIGKQKVIWPLVQGMGVVEDIHPRHLGLPDSQTTDGGYGGQTPLPTLGTLTIPAKQAVVLRVHSWLETTTPRLPKSAPSTSQSSQKGSWIPTATMNGASPIS